MNERYPLVVYFDASCVLCNSEMQVIKAHDVAQRLVMTDCSAVNFDDTPFRAEGVTRENMMTCLHVRDNRGEWTRGVSAFELLYRTVGKTSLANLWGSRMMRPFIELAYPWVARHRQLLSWSGLPLLFKLWGWYEARRAYQHSRRCHNGKCSI
jgi:predicted DCC family thiol-disulfide oxidoreductase YuxK